MIESKKINDLGSFFEIIKTIGNGRISFLVMLFIVNLLCAALIYIYINPSKYAAILKNSDIKQQINTLSSDIKSMRATLSDIINQKGTFEEIQRRGFFSNQDRSEAEIIIKSMERIPGIIKTSARIGQVNIIRDEIALKAGHVILESPVEIDIESVDDISVLRYISEINKNFKGYVVLKSMNAERTEIFDAALLRDIANGKNTALVKTKLFFLWYTMVPDQQKIESEEEI